MTEEEARELLDSGVDLVHFELVHEDDPPEVFHLFWVRISNIWYWYKSDRNQKWIKSRYILDMTDYSESWKYKALTPEESQQYILDITFSLLTDA